MKIAIWYYSKGGNTKLMAETLASKCELTAESTEVNLTEKVDFLFLGSSASGKSTQPQIKKWGDANGVLVNENFFNCPGHFLINKLKDSL